MVLSVIIVNYRVRYFLELCLYSVSKALADIEAEVIVVDNHSDDGSVEALKPLFPSVQFIVNQENTGFAAANNQGLRRAGGEYILFLNPDTVLPEDYVRICLDFLRDKPKAGGLGVRMIDGSGRFLKSPAVGSLLPGSLFAGCPACPPSSHGAADLPATIWAICRRMALIRRPSFPAPVSSCVGGFWMPSAPLMSASLCTQRISILVSGWSGRAIKTIIPPVRR